MPLSLDTGAIETIIIYRFSMAQLTWQTYLSFRDVILWTSHGYGLYGKTSLLSSSRHNSQKSSSIRVFDKYSRTIGSVLLRLDARSVSDLFRPSPDAD